MGKKSREMNGDVFENSPTKKNGYVLADDRRGKGSKKKRMTRGKKGVGIMGSMIHKDHDPRRYIPSGKLNHLAHGG